MSYADWVAKAKVEFPKALADWKATLVAHREPEIKIISAKLVQDFWKRHLNGIGHKLVFQVLMATDFETNTVNEDRIKLKFEM